MRKAAFKWLLWGLLTQSSAFNIFQPNARPASWLDSALRDSGVAEEQSVVSGLVERMRQATVTQAPPVEETYEAFDTTDTEPLSKTPFEDWFIGLQPKEKKVEEKTADPTPLAVEGNWAAYWDQEDTGYIYYYNKASGESVWDVPTITFPNFKLQKGMKRATKQKPAAAWGVPATEWEEDAPRPLAREGEWTAYFDTDGMQLIYYYNEETGLSQWEKPTETFPDVQLTSRMRERVLRTSVAQYENPFLHLFDMIRNPPKAHAVWKNQMVMIKGTEIASSKVEDEEDEGLNLLNPAEFLEGFGSFFFSSDKKTQTSG